MPTIILENDHLKATFSRETAALLELINKTTGWHIQRRPELALSFRLLVPMPQRHANRVHGAQHTIEELTVAPDGQSFTALWRNLASEHGGTLDITFRGTVTLTGPTLSLPNRWEERCTGR